MMLGFMYVVSIGCAMKIISVSVIMYTGFYKWKQKNQQTENC